MGDVLPVVKCYLFGDKLRVQPGHHKVYLLPTIKLLNSYGGARKGQVFNVNLA